MYWVKTALQSRFNVIEFVDVYKIDNNFEDLKKQLLRSKLDFYTPNDRYVIDDDDTHYYLPGCSYSLSWYNIIQTFLDVDIPLSSIIIFYNGHGLLEQILPLIPHELQDLKCVPYIIDRKSDCWLIAGGYLDDIFIKNFNKEKPIVNTINKHAVTMMGKTRVHRNIIHNHIKEKQLFNKIATAYKNVS
jgi:hypothetical protein